MKAASLDLRPILLVVGILLIILALFMAPPMVADLAAGHPDWQVFLAASAVTLFIGVSLLLMNRAPGFSEITGRQAFLLTTIVWIVLTFFAALPLMFSELEMDFTDAIFEAMSGITTTGSTVIVGLDYAPPGILLWRAILQWLGGIGIIVMGVAILPMLRVGGMQLVRAESSDLSEKILPRAAQIASAIGMIYLSLTFACATLYWLGGMTPFDAAAHSMTTIATGGFSTRDSSIGGFQSASIEWIAILFMVLGSLPFVLYIQVTNGKVWALFRDSQVRWFLGIVLLSAALVLAWLVLRSDAPWIDALRHALFNTLAVITGTGYASADFGAWGTLPVALFFFSHVRRRLHRLNDGRDQDFPLHGAACDRQEPAGPSCPAPWRVHPKLQRAPAARARLDRRYGVLVHVRPCLLGDRAGAFGNGPGLSDGDVGCADGVGQCGTRSRPDHRPRRQLLLAAGQREVAVVGSHAARPAGALDRAHPVHTDLLAILVGCRQP